ncbi:MAG: hypothetical protein JWR42_1125 [Marmoricola sp.]|nr:hypothetical protein [Marmoricola sp.]
MSASTPPPGGGSYEAAPPPPPGGGYGGGGYGGYGAVPQGNNKKAIWSLVLGILGLVCCGFFTGIPALILGRSAQREIEASGGAQKGAGMAKAGFILGILSIVLGIVGVILSLTGVIDYNFTAGRTSP